MYTHFCIYSQTLYVHIYNFSTFFKISQPSTHNLTVTRSIPDKGRIIMTHSSMFSNMLIQHLDQALLWSSREIRDASDFPLKPPRGEEAARQPAVESLWQRPVRRGLITIKGRLEKPSWKSRGVCREGWVAERREGGNERGWSLKHVAVETESSVGQCEVRGVILGGDCS